MRCERNATIICLLILLFLLGAGCDRKPAAEQPAAPAQPQTQTNAGVVDIDQPISEVEAEAETMSVDNLKATALKYKEAILAKQADLEKLAAKVKEIPVMEALGQEAQALKTDLSNVEDTLAALKERFQVYYNKLKEKGADLSALQL